jgi:high-affinity iron transporter
MRESLETSVIVSILLAFLKQTLGPDQDPLVYKKLRRQVSPSSACNERAQI